uniref:DNA repair protein RecO-like protein n=1 Tax=Cyanoptyche gloeocystis TaxID=77922 RepID=A0A3G1IWF0_9EUKA|nr:DNA repair protein RecO-like protein [Cyanoptyche gloeocystis]
MIKTYKSYAVLLRSTSLGNNEYIFTFFTKENGLVKVFIPNTFNYKIKDYTLLKVHLKKRRSFSEILDISIITNFKYLEPKTIKNKSAFYLSQLLFSKYFLYLNHTEQYLVFDIFVYYLNKLDKTINSKVPLIIIRGLLHLICLGGFAPEMSFCDFSNEFIGQKTSTLKEKIYFSFENGEITKKPNKYKKGSILTSLKIRLLQILITNINYHRNFVIFSLLLEPFLYTIFDFVNYKFEKYIGVSVYFKK